MREVELPGRPKELARMYTVDAHAKAPRYGEHRKNIYITMMDTSPKGIKAVREWLHEAKIPEGTDAAVDVSGEFHCFTSVSPLIYD